jgi:DNA-binding LacI/PurR family transcriptional regulator
VTGKRPGGALGIGEVARLAGVSRSTVSYAITGKRPVSEETRERIFAVMRDAGYKPNAAAQALRRGSTNTLGMVIPPADHSHLTAGQLVLVGAAVEAAADRDFDILMSPGGRDRDASLARLIGTRRIDGLLITEAQVHDTRVKQAQESSVPFVVIGRTVDRPTYDWVDLDWVASVRACVDHLVTVGRKRLILVNRSAPLIEVGYGSAVRSHRAFLEAVHEHGVQGESMPCDDNAHAAAGFVSEMLARVPDVDGIVSINEMSLPGLVPALQQHGRDVPADVSVCAVAMSPLGLNGSIKLTTVENPLAEMAERAVESLVSRVHGSGSTVHVLLAPPLVVRESSVPPASDGRRGRSRRPRPAART